jgi:uncharacterized SAM-binding protein YcdF (DUF218 family)
MSRFLFSTDAVVVAFLATALWKWSRPRSRAADRSAVAIAAAYLAASMYVVPATALRAWTYGFRPVAATDVRAGTTAVVVLAAGENDIRGWKDRFSVMSVAEGERLLETVRVFRLIGPAWIISSGGPELGADPGEPSSTVMRDALARFGVPPSRILLESTSRSTREEAVLIASMLQSLHVDHVVLVTSDSHMRRSLGAFRAAGVYPVPAIAPDTWAFGTYQDWLLPSNHGLYLTNELAHELFGLPYYWLRGWWR